MSFDLCILASGSSGNCTLVRSPKGSILIDGGLGPRQLAQRLMGTGISLDQLAGVCVTHLDRDHLASHFLAFAGRNGLPVYCHEMKADRLRFIAAELNCGLDVRSFGDHPFDIIDGLAMEPIPLAHDAEGSHGFVMTSEHRRAGFATDLGRVPSNLLDRFCDAGGLDVLAIESNYCPQMQLTSNRPDFLKRRIMGGKGHLSNLQAFNAVRIVLDRHQAAGYELPATVALLHRSRQCNCPERVRDVFTKDRRVASRLILAEQTRPTGWLKLRSGESPTKQLEFAWG